MLELLGFIPIIVIIFGMSNDNYYFVDGPSLLNDIHEIRKLDGFASARLSIVNFIKKLNDLRHLHNESFRRFTIYLTKSDESRLERCVDVPNPLVSDVFSADFYVQYCGKKVRKSSDVESWLRDNNAPQYVEDLLHRSEKAVDTQICCDSMQLAGIRKLDRLFLYTNDSDFIPLCTTLRQMGCNVSLFTLRESGKINIDLARECDSVETFSYTEYENLFVGNIVSAS